MTSRSVFTILLATSLWLTGFSPASAQDIAPAAIERQLKLDLNAEATLQELFASNPDVVELYDRAVGYAVFSATKAGFLVTGGAGTGVLVNKGTAERIYMRMGTGGIGLAIGAQRYDIVILFETEARLNNFKDGGWDSSVTAQAAAGSDGIAASSTFFQGIAFFQITDRGLMATADVAGTHFWVADKLN